MAEVPVKVQYPYSDKYDYDTELVRIDLDQEREDDIRSNNGFIISDPKSIKKDIKSIDGIFSSRFGQTLQDITPYADRYKCQCGATTSRINHGSICKICGTKVKYVDDNFGYFGWVCLKDPYHIIHPNLYKAIASLIGEKKFVRIISPIDEKDQDGHSLENVKKPTDEPFYGLGMIGFKEKFQEIIDYYVQKNAAKQECYDDIMDNVKKVFIQSIPVYTTHLRPFRLDGDSLFFEGTNGLYTMIVKFVSDINKDKLAIDRKIKPKNQLLYDLQKKYNELYKELENTISGKKGSIRSLFGGRYNFTGRAVITLDTQLRIDQVRLPYTFLVEILQQSIINILHKSYHITYADAYKAWYKASMKRLDPTICEIINSIIKNSGRGIPVLINRNPTINYGSIVQMFCVGINDNYTMSIPYGILTGLAADFDGDILNILYIINKEFLEMANLVLNPRNAMYISKNDGYLNMGVLPMRDTLVNANTMIYLSRDKYSQEQLDQIARVRAM